ncbi:hypothetical protein P0D91_27120 [Pseudomonas sp. CBSPBW29]|uniref:hypothetical protein n=1 Tax=Pseudomonas sp. CBS TaxID=2971912 RepID=UPI0021ACF50C|nr:hypothetical protein [Pseudomonas sp. CBS]WEL41762.1 hypothetical protein P0D91_27120 [Pseudomonas sp. CBSPBW29]WEL62824.1 hypothetical protein P0D93_21295 [Pseudomonas sp. CBSPGW29]WEL72006.1 hypothetical protein P0D94_07230 [Pseudomonas sp. CBSPCGW29]WEL78902.1 hypothetical protein P0D92_13215 [Pseudomonas sp. CBSPAW29]WEL82442.1 hypothetical protein P0D95_32585 [Pseudomonas sp. CBSPCAW29]WEL90915.1 hypothetical protein P0D90_14865 [Pseudomonas sp. CBSPCBW29]
MKATLKAHLQTWMNRLEALQDTEHDRHSDYDPYSDYDFFLEYKVMGIATFLKQVAYQEDDLDLLAFASKAEMQVESMIRDNEAAEEEADREHQELQQESYEHDERIRKACAYHFYTVPAFSIDTSKYEVMVQDAASRFTDPYKLSSLRRYLESDQVLGRVYEKVKSRLRRTFDRVGDSPTLEEIAQAFDVEMTNIYRLADAHVDRTIAQYAP